jgi:DnaK suppressor protein
VDSQDDLDFVLIQMKTETLNKIEEALRRLSEGTYGNCIDCAGEIAESRLRALPFAIRCRECEELRERSSQRARTAMSRASGSLPFELRL